MNTPPTGANMGAALARGVAIAGPDDIWFGGDWSPGPLAMHWDGSSFEILPTPSFGVGGHAIERLAAISSDDVWGVGGARDGDFAGTNSNLFHWDGSVWEHVPGPTPGVQHRFFDVAAAGPDDVWAVGGSSPGGPMILHWDGSQWTEEPLPGFVHPHGELDAVTALAPDDVWAAGTYTINEPPDLARPLLLHFDGAGWTQVAADPASGNLGWFRGMDHLGADVWAAGALGNGLPHVERYVPSGAGTAFCDASDGALAMCPCGNVGAPDAGCDNSQGTGGVRLSVAAFDPAGPSATLVGAGYPPASSPAAVVIRSSALEGVPQTFFDGVRCIGLQDFTRLAAGVAVGGTSTHVFGHGAGPGSFHYQLWYRNTPAGFCDPAAAANVSSGTTLSW